MAKEPEYDVVVLAREEETRFPKIATPVIYMRITYVAAGLPPETIWIPKPEYSIEEEKKRIREDIERRLKLKPETYKV